MEFSPTDRELEILKVLWELGEGSVRAVHEQLEPTTGLHFNTIQTQLRIMDDKGLVRHRKDGRTFVYKPVCTRDDISSRFLHKVFDGAVNDLVLSMLSAEKLSSDELKELEQLVAKSRKNAAGRSSKSSKKGK